MKLKTKLVALSLRINGLIDAGPATIAKLFSCRNLVTSSCVACGAKRISVKAPAPGAVEGAEAVT